MTKPWINFKLLNSDAKLPSYKREGDAAFDICSIEEVTLKPGERRGVSTGLASEFPKDWFISLRDRSGLALNNGIHLLGGVVDSNYRGEWKVILVNLGEEEYKIEKGERIAQAILHYAPNAKISEVKELSQNEIRGEKGFGSSGKK